MDSIYYGVNRNSEGVVESVILYDNGVPSMFIPRIDDLPVWVDFLNWNSEQPTPFDLDSVTVGVEITWDDIRNTRAPLLQAADVLVNKAEDSEALSIVLGYSSFDARSYRQALRDVTTTFVSPDLVVWPQRPDISV